MQMCSWKKKRVVYLRPIASWLFTADDRRSTIDGGASVSQGASSSEEKRKSREGEHRCDEQLFNLPACQRAILGVLHVHLARAEKSDVSDKGRRGEGGRARSFWENSSKMQEVAATASEHMRDLKPRSESRVVHSPPSFDLSGSAEVMGTHGGPADTRALRDLPPSLSLSHSFPLPTTIDVHATG